MSLTTLSLLLIFLCTCIMYVSDAWIAFVYFACTIQFVVFQYFFRSSDHRLRGFFSIVSLAVFLTFFIRPLVLVFFPEFFKFFRLGQIYRDDLVPALVVSAVMSAALLGSLFVALQPIKLSARSSSSVQEKIEIQIFDRPAFKYFIVAISLFYAFIVIFLGFGSKATSGTEYLRLVLPFDLILPALFVLAWRIKKWNFEKTVWVFLTLIICASVTIRGSKSAAFIILICILSLALYSKPSQRIKYNHLLSLSIVTVFILPILIYISNIFRFGGNMKFPIMYYSSEYLSAPLLFIMDVISKRLNGFEGVVALKTFDDIIDTSHFSWIDIFKTVIAKLLPGVSFGSVPMGIEIGRVVNLVDNDVAYGGSLGLFGSSIAFSGAIGSIFVLGFLGVLLGKSVRLVMQVKAGPEQAFLYIFMAYTAAFWLVSGNFDNLLTNLTIAGVHLVFYTLLLGRMTFVQTNTRQLAPIPPQHFGR